MPNEPCRLCLKYATNLIDVFSYHGKSIQLKISVFFSLQLKPNDSIRCICMQCIFIIEEFHKYYEHVKQTQLDLVHHKLLYERNLDSTQTDHLNVIQLEQQDYNKIKFNSFSTLKEPDILMVTQEESKITDDKQSCTKLEINTENIIPSDSEVKKEIEQISDNIDENSTDCLEEQDNSKNYHETNAVETFSNEIIIHNGNRTKRKKCKNKILYHSKPYSSVDFPTELIKDGKLVTKGSRLEILINKFYNIQCELCPGFPKFKKMTKLMNHYKKVHGCNGFLTCCNIRLYQHRTIYLHMARHLQPSAFECPLCKKAVTRPHSLKLHMQTHLQEADKQYKCDQCDRRFGYPDGLSLHKQSQHVPIEDRIVYNCEKCDKRFTLFSSFKAHVKSMHSGTQYLCSECGRCFKRKAEYKIHTLTHDTTGENQKQCQHCGFVCKNRITLKIHLRRHTPGPALQCNDCPYKSHRKYLLQRHIQTTHCDIKPFDCIICGMKFKTKSLVKSHMRKHTDPKISCPYCPKTFTSNGGYIKHRKRTHNEMSIGKQENIKDI